MSVTEEIRTYVIEVFHKKKEEVENLQLHKLLSLVELKNLDKYHEFKNKLRTNGWII